MAPRAIENPDMIIFDLDPRQASRADDRAAGCDNTHPRHHAGLIQINREPVDLAHDGGTKLTGG
jgi:hypothetical protein